jgi:N-acetylglutamate synthase-like GNAT family acetyltransferase
MVPLMSSHPEHRRRQQAALSPDSLHDVARSAFAECVRLYDEQDQIIVHMESFELRLIYISVRASRQSSFATSIQCCVNEERPQMWIRSLQVPELLRRQGLAHEMIQAAESIARALGLSEIMVDTQRDVAGFWTALGYAPHESVSRVLRKDISQAIDNSS